MHQYAEHDHAPLEGRPLRQGWLPRMTTREVEAGNREHVHEGEWREQLMASGFCLFFTFVGWMAEHPTIGLVSFLLAYLSGGWFTAQEVLEKLRERVVDVHFLMLAVAAGAGIIGEWREGAILLFLFSFSGALEHYAMERTQKEIRSLFKNVPKTATVVDDAGVEHVAPV